jgi:hypothetical protein
MPLHIGTLGKSTLCAQQPIIIRFKNASLLEFPSLEEAYGFLTFYNQNPTGRAENPGKIYQLVSGVWLEQPDQPPPKPAT